MNGATSDSGGDRSHWMKLVKVLSGGLTPCSAVPFQFRLCIKLACNKKNQVIGTSNHKPIDDGYCPDNQMIFFKLI